MSYRNDRGILVEQSGKNGAANVILCDEQGVPYKASGGSGGGGSTDLTPIIQRIGELVAAPDALTQLGRLKALADLLTTLDTDLVSRIGDVNANPAANTVLARLLNVVTSVNTVNTTLSTLLAAIRDSVKSPQFSAITIRSVVTSAASGATPVFFGSYACTQLDIVNDTGVDIEYYRNATGTYMPILAGTSRMIVGITNASQIGVRRVDQVATAVTVKAEAFQL